jgi:hypothetical protein
LLTATVTFTGMPTENGSFGTKTARITCSGGGLSFDKTTEYEVFFPKNATNHPTCASCANCPNWFYYWKKVTYAVSQAMLYMILREVLVGVNLQSILLSD